jgi:hypothetical protein
MPYTSYRHRLARLAAGLSVVAATSATTLLTAAPAQAATPVTVTKALGSVMRINGSDGQESVQVSIFNGFVTVSNTLGSVQAGSGCTQLGAAVRCDGVTLIGYNGGGGDDSFRNDTSLTVSGNGGLGNDRYTGGPGQDRYKGGPGNDIVNGGNGSDTCDAESESACELDFPPPPRIRLP